MEELRSRGFAKVDLGQGDAPHAEGGFSFPDGRLSLDAARTSRRPRWPTRRSAKRFPLAMITPKTHLFLNSTFANQERQHGAQPEPYVVVHPRGRRSRARWPTAPARACSTTAARSCARRACPTTPAPGVVVAPMGWWSGDYEGGVGAQATTSQRLTEAGRGADVQRQPGGGRGGLTRA